MIRFQFVSGCLKTAAPFLAPESCAAFIREVNLFESEGSAPKAFYSKFWKFFFSQGPTDKSIIRQYLQDCRIYVNLGLGSKFPEEALDEAGENGFMLPSITSPGVTLDVVATSVDLALELALRSAELSRAHAQSAAVAFDEQDDRIGESILELGNALMQIMQRKSTIVRARIATALGGFSALNFLSPFLAEGRG